MLSSLRAIRVQSEKDGWALPYSLMADYFCRWIESIIFVAKESSLRAAMKQYFELSSSNEEQVSK